MDNWNIQDQQKENSVVKISEDKLCAYLYLCPPEDGSTYTEEDIYDLLKTNKITTGIKETQIKQIVEKGIYYKDILIAEGIKKKDGQDGRYEFLFDLYRDRKPRILADGSVDYTNMDAIVMVKAGDLIVKYHPATKGENGVTVNGMTILGKNGRELLPLRGKGFTISEDKLSYYALIDGKIDYENDQLIISNLLVVEGDVDNISGNINFHGDVLIKGNITTRMEVKAKGDITVNGHVEAAILTAGKNITLKNGMQGIGKGIISAGGNVEGKFFEQVMISAKGSIKANAILNCQIEAEEEVIVSGRLGVLVGGETQAIGGVKATIIGNMAEVKTNVSVGIGEESMTELVQLNERIKQSTSELEKIEKAVKLLEESLAKERNPVLSQKKVQLLRMKIASSTELFSMSAKKEQIIRWMDRSAHAQVAVQKQIYPGSKITVNGISLLVKDMHTNVIIKRKGGDVCIFANED